MRVKHHLCPFQEQTNIYVLTTIHNVMSTPPELKMAAQSYATLPMLPVTPACTKKRLHLEKRKERERKKFPEEIFTSWFDRHAG